MSTPGSTPVQQPLFDGLEKAIKKAMLNHPEQVHIRTAENTSACLQGGDKQFVEVWGQYLTDEPELVGCRACLEWLHA